MSVPLACAAYPPDRRGTLWPLRLLPQPSPGVRLPLSRPAHYDGPLPLLSHPAEAKREKDEGKDGTAASRSRHCERCESVYYFSERLLATSV